MKRAPAQPLIVVPERFAALATPVYGYLPIGDIDNDLTRQHDGEPLGERIIVAGRVLDEDGRPVSHTLVELWQCNAAGRYRHARDTHPAPIDPNFSGGGRTITDAEGRYRFVTIKPGAYPWANHDNAWRPAHIHFSVFGRSIATRLVTQMYFPERPVVRLRPDVPVGARSARAATARVAVRSVADRAQLGARLPVRHHPPRARFDAVRRAHMSDPDLPLVATASQTIGPFFHVGPGASDRCGVVAAPDVPGERIRLRIVVLDGDAAPVSDALIELRQADARGVYTTASGPGEPPPSFTGFGRLGTSEDGYCAFRDDPPGRTCRVAGHRGRAHRRVSLRARV